VVSTIQRAIEALEIRKALEPQCLLGLSGGKDSIVCLDLAIKVYGKQNVIPFFMEFIPGLDITERQLRYPRERFNLEKIYYVQDEEFWHELRSGKYTWQTKELEKIPQVRRRDILYYVSRTFKINTIVLGVKRNDSTKIRRMIESGDYYANAIYPIWDWKLPDVLGYMVSNRIEIPDTAQYGFRSVSTDDGGLNFIAEFCPNDFDRMEVYFPFVRAGKFRFDKWGRFKVQRGRITV